MAIDLATGFNIGSKDAIDERQVLTLEQMKNLDESIYPDKYFAICKDNGKLYIFNASNEIDEETGKFRKVSSNESVDTSIFQKINDDTLITEDKTIVGAINELKTGVSSISVPTQVSQLTNDSGYITSDEVDLIKEYNPDETYNEGQICLYDNYVWLCKTVTTGTFEESNWEKQTDNITELDLNTIKTFLGLTPEQLETMADIISSEIRTDKVFSSYETYTRIDNALKEAKQYCITSIPDEYITETELNAKGYLTSHQDISNLQTKTDNSLTTTDKTVTGAINELKTNISNINTGGGSSFSGSYNDLTDKPTIPTKTSDLNNDSNYVKSTELSTVATSGSYNDLTDKPIVDCMEYRRLIDNSVYGKMGDFFGIQAGYLRKYNKPKKIVVLGNSLTFHGRYEADGIEWTVDDYREMASSLPNSGWVSKIQQYITQNVNPDCKVYKANIATWEKATNGSRTWKDAVSSNIVCEVKADKPYVVEGETVDTILTEDTDIVIIQAYENISAPTTPAEKLNLAKDYINLYSTIREKCPNVKLYQFCGFWHSETITQSVIGACRYSKVVPIQALTTLPNFNMSNNIRIESATGDAIYDGEGNQIATVSSIVAGHPNDTGFNIMATYVINALYNEITFNNSQTVLQFGRTTTVDNPRITELFNTNYRDGNFTEHYKQWFNYFLIPGEYNATINIGDSPAHGTFKVICALSQSFSFSGEEPTSALMYHPLRQEWRSHNNTIDSGLITRCTKISSEDSVWGDFKNNTYTGQ